MAKYVHNLVGQVAQDMAAEIYEVMAKDNTFYKFWPNQKKFVHKNWKQFIKDARATLATMLTNDKYTDEQKDDILQALLLDRALPPAGDTSVQVPTASLIH